MDLRLWNRKQSVYLNNNLGLVFFILGFFYYIYYNYRKAEISLGEERIKVEEEKMKSENLLHNILPVPIAERLKKDTIAIADGFSYATILFADIVGFTSLSEKMSPKELVSLLNKIFSEFDLMSKRYGLEKIKTIGDAYMVAGGLPIPIRNHASNVADFAIEMKNIIQKYNNESPQKINIRIGIHSGPVVAGVIGLIKFTYDVWGDTVNTASRMESHSLPGKIHVSENTFSLLKKEYIFTDRGIIEIKGKGPMKTFFLESKIL